MKIIFVGLLIVLAWPSGVEASIPTRYTNDNIFSATHDAPKTLLQDGAGGFYGVTLTGKIYTQKPIANMYGIKLHKFVIDDAWFYMSDHGLITADTDIAALSIYLTLS